jgi:hypothetical protein
MLNVLTFLALCVSIYTVWQSNRARLVITIEKKAGGFYFKIENVGKSVAHNIKIHVTGKPIDNTMYKMISFIFKDLDKRPFSLGAGEKIYFPIGPSKVNVKRLSDSYIWLNHDNVTVSQIEDWVNKNHNAEIVVCGWYNGFWHIRRRAYSISEYIALGAFRFEDPNESIAKSLRKIANSQNLD